jgi:tRNA (cmo5U34)-methyltransferase
MGIADRPHDLSCAGQTAGGGRAQFSFQAPAVYTSAVTTPHASASAPEYWGQKAAEYDAFIRRVVPRYDELIERLLDTLPRSARRVLELGCGTGNLSAALLERLPDAHLTSVDAAPEMIAIARARLAERFPHARSLVRLVTARIEELPVEPAVYDLVVSSLTLHHVRDIGAVYHSMRRSMAGGASLRVADGYGGATPALHANHWARWEAFWREPGNLDQEEIRSVLQHAREHDHYVTIEEHFRLLHEAGFSHCDCVWRDGLFALVTAEAS